MRPSCGATISIWTPSGVSYLVRAVFKDSSFMRRGNLEYIQTFNTNPAPIDLPPRCHTHCMLALNERANQRPDLRGDRLSINRQLGGLSGQEPTRLHFFFWWR
jgi:hypothetical protein